MVYFFSPIIVDTYFLIVLWQRALYLPKRSLRLSLSLSLFSNERRKKEKPEKKDRKKGPKRKTESNSNRRHGFSIAFALITQVDCFGFLFEKKIWKVFKKQRNKKLMKSNHASLLGCALHCIVKEGNKTVTEWLQKSASKISDGLLIFALFIEKILAKMFS